MVKIHVTLIELFRHLVSLKLTSTLKDLGMK